MNRSKLALLVLSGCLLMPSFAQAASLVLKDGKLGYSISFPQGWQQAPDDMVKSMTKMASDEFQASGASAGKPQGATLIDQQAQLFKVYALVPLKREKIDSDQRMAKAAGGDKEALKSLLADAKKTVGPGAKTLSSQTTRDGYCFNTTQQDKNMPKGAAMYQRSCTRFVGENVYVYFGLYIGAAGAPFDKEFQTLVDGLKVGK